MKDKRKGRPDFLLLFLTFFLVGFGLIMVFSASYTTAIMRHDFSSYYAMKQGVFAFFGLFLMFVFMLVPLDCWKKASPFLLLVTLLMLAFVLVQSRDVNGARRWVAVGGFTLQPSELAKLTVIVYLATAISRKGEQIRDFRRGLIPVVTVIGLISLLVLKQPDFGTVLILIGMAVTILLVGDAALRHLFLLGLSLISLFSYLAFSKSYRLKRINSFLSPFEDPQGSGYQLIQSLIALGHGGFTGTGIGHSIQKIFYLPEAHTDFILAVIGEELGFVGTSSLIIVFFLFIWRGFRAAFRSNNSFALMLGIGIVMMIFLQFLLNVGAVVGALPITGVPLPFISYGGSSLVLCLASTGILLNISRASYPKHQELGRNSKK
ncbi:MULTISPECIES: putative lipid II flippase FtsW [unclassified Paenibacillus]|uniref:putative lipid II flippase FtsW n=1 Tax=unclassified Paenibacillus TaxID=185978 RepID=UPI000839BFE8|nr:MULTISPECIES: putative lipid II flippase FtsW [unclassified Paenibacillus]NWL89921.1 putative lipid II flippase FtsW [Paenibacillus sp. 79R4]